MIAALVLVVVSFVQEKAPEFCPWFVGLLVTAIVAEAGFIAKLYRDVHR